MVRLATWRASCLRLAACDLRLATCGLLLATCNLLACNLSTAWRSLLATPPGNGASHVAGEEFEVEQILAKRIGVAGRTEYCVRWKGYTVCKLLMLYALYIHAVG